MATNIVLYLKRGLPPWLVTLLRRGKSRLRCIPEYLPRRAKLAILRARRDRGIAKYMATCWPRKVQLGAGCNCLKGWLNTDGFAESSFNLSLTGVTGRVFLNVCERFPFEDNSIDYVFSEHVIEHLNYDQGQRMMVECFRIMRPGGRIRIATPDCGVFVSLYGPNRSVEQETFLEEYVRFNTSVWSSDLANVTGDAAVFVINHTFRAWGHQFIYDYAVLADALEKAGFVEIERELPRISRDSHLTNLECREDIVGVFDALIVEARKPLGPEAASSSR